MSNHIRFRNFKCRQLWSIYSSYPFQKTMISYMNDSLCTALWILKKSILHSSTMVNDGISFFWPDTFCCNENLHDYVVIICMTTNTKIYLFLLLPTCFYFVVVCFLSSSFLWYISIPGTPLRFTEHELKKVFWLQNEREYNICFYH